jgi:hypothetical protein
MTLTLSQALPHPIAGMGAKALPNGCSLSNFHVRPGQSAVHKRYRLPLFLFALLLFLGPWLAQAKTYYLSPTGNDGNTGESARLPWLSPNHPLTCGDVIVAAPGGNYSAANFFTGKWGTVSCPAANSVAWLQCATFDACKIRAETGVGMWIDKSFWGVQGWEVTTTAADPSGTCFSAQPNYASPVEIHHIIFANDVANGCSQGGFALLNRGHAGVDYFAVVGSVAYNAAQGTGICASGISIYHPIQSDTLPGTHIYVAGNFSYGNLEPKKCGGGSPTAGEGIIFDNFDGSRAGLPPYWSQAVAVNNIVVSNGAIGIQIDNNTTGSYHSTVWVDQNTTWGNLTDSNQAWLGCAEISLFKVSDTHIRRNVIATRSATGCGGHPIYALAVSSGDNTDSVVQNLAYGHNGNNTFLYSSGSFSWGQTNQLGTSPDFSNPLSPAAPRCSNTPSVPKCMAKVIADFTPKAPSAQGLGYQKPTAGQAKDPLFPRWLCTAHLPSGLVTTSCD